MFCLLKRTNFNKTKVDIDKVARKPFGSETFCKIWAAQVCPIPHVPHHFDLRPSADTVNVRNDL